MAISTNSVIHYTERIDYLTGIIKSQGFRLKYCCEDLDVLMNKPINSAFPMVSFCDIPLSEVKNHIDSYGSYGIGLSKSWAKKNKLNPVLYLEKESGFSSHINQQVQKIFFILDKIHSNKKVEKCELNLLQDTVILISYCKNYEGPLIRGKINTENYRFYDEREWRYIPTKKEIKNAPLSLQGDQYRIEKEKYNDAISDIFLEFSFNDISYIIIDSENEIPEILNTLNEVYENTCTTRELKILSTKIITKNQIYNDF